MILEPWMADVAKTGVGVAFGAGGMWVWMKSLGSRVKRLEQRQATVFGDETGKPLFATAEKMEATTEEIREHYDFEIARVISLCHEYREACHGHFKDDVAELKIEINAKFKVLDEKVDRVADTATGTREILLLMASPEVRESIIAQQTRSR